MPCTHRLMRIVMLILASICAPWVHAAPLYAVVDMGDLGSNNSLPYAINNAGQVAGFSTITSGFIHAFLYSGGAMSDISPASVAFSWGAAINNSGQVLVSSNVGNSFLYDIGLGSVVDTGVSGATDINDVGDIAGNRILSSSNVQAYTLSGGVQTFLPTLGGSYTAASAINNSGQVAGLSYLSGATGAYRAFIHDTNGIVAIGTFGGSASAANDLNNKGQVVGYARTANDAETHPFLYDSQTGTMTDLGTLGSWLNNAYGLNDLGQVVGVAYMGASGGVHGTLYDDDTLYDLNDLIDPLSGWVIQDARDINNAGQIIATGYNRQLQRSGALLLNPFVTSTAQSVPEPASLLLIGLAMVVLVSGRVRQRAVADQ